MGKIELAQYMILLTFLKIVTQELNKLSFSELSCTQVNYFS
ncbi:hypothetical protein AALB_2030 [Agarivorans albus MKT 106]|uniref:Uncharacterized protein n=1 Tax=Agarivorans albus MKT 106 TaxID=1331007 RepID=R9PKT8_AGAAL|nr:hypothetical protein AALB_2030 [Agarivorans albus MKT 106]